MFSVVVSCLDCAASLAATLDSALASDNVCEVIVVDRGSRDATLDVLARMSVAEPRLEVLRLRGATAAHARNAGICAARSDIVAFLDGGDVWNPGYVEAHLSRFAAEPDLGISFGSARDAVGTPDRELPTAMSPIDCLIGGPGIVCSALVVRRAVFDDIGLFNLALHWTDCREWLFRASLSGWRIQGIPRARVDIRGLSPASSASDSAIEADLEAFLSDARRVAPAIVDEYAQPARAVMCLSLAQRALQLDRDRAVARKHLRAALAAWPVVVFAAPKDVLRVAAGSLSLPERLASLFARALPQ